MPVPSAAPDPSVSPDPGGLPARACPAELSVSAISMGVLVALVGFASSFAIVLAGLREAGASEAEAASGLMALSIGMGPGMPSPPPRPRP